MKRLIDSDAIKKQGLKESEFYYLLFKNYTSNIEELENSLQQRGFLNFNKKITTSGVEILDTILLNSIQPKDIDDNFYEEIAEELKSLYPQGRKPGTNYMWRGTTAEIVRKLKTLTIKYKFKFTKEQAVKATKDYISSFNGNYSYMQLLKYFILKTVRDADGNVEIKSEFMSRIENSSQNDEIEWTEVVL